MKRIVSIAVTLLFFFTLMLPITVTAAECTATLSGPKTVRAGDTITLNFNVSGEGVFGLSGTLQYDAEQLTLVNTAPKVSAPWVVEFNGDNFVAFDNNLANPISSETTLFSVTFAVKELSVGTKINVSCANVTVSDGSSDTNLDTVTYSRSVATPLSGDATLADLVITNAVISPSFSPDVTDYTAEVPFSVDKLNVTAMPNDTKGSVSVYSPNLVPGGTTKVTVTVTAENGATKTYTITVNREGNPNYTPSNNNLLSSIKVEGFMLSPAFNAEITEYVVWLPYEVNSIKISGTAADTRASVEVVGGKNLAAGQDNVVKVICTAESGEQRIYNVTVKRAAGHDGSVDEKPNVETDTDDLSNENNNTAEGTKTDNSMNMYWLLIVGFAALLIGFALGIFSKKIFKF